MKTEKLFAVLDQGSSSVRAFIVDAQGKIVSKKYKEFTPNHMAPGMAQYDGQELLDIQLSLLQELLDSCDLKKIDSISVTSQRSTVVLWDKRTGKTVAPVLTWQDGRGARQTEAVQIPQADIHKKTGLYKTPFYSASKITWCFENIPGVKELAAQGNILIGPVATYIIWHLTGGKVFAVDPTLAQRTLLFNINTFEWDQDLLDAFGVPADSMPELKHTVDDYGFHKGIPIKVCIGDQQSAAAGLGLKKEGDAVINYGTGAFVLISTGTTLKSVPGILTSVGPTSALTPKFFMLEGPVNAAGAVFQWFNSIGLNFDLNDIDDLYARAQNPVWFLPAFGGIGAPYWDFNAPTVMSGFTTATKKEDIVAGGVKSLAFMIADIIFYIKNYGVAAENIKVSGGFAKNHSLINFQAGILQSKIAQTVETETTSLGAVSLAAAQAGVEVALWDNFNSQRDFAPALSPAQAAQEYQKWRTFFDWCRSFK